MAKKRKIKKVKFRDMRNEEWYQLFVEFKKLVEKHGADKLNIAALFVVFVNMFARADSALAIIRKSLETAQMDEADLYRDGVFRGFYDQVKGLLHHFDAAKRAAAERVFLVLDAAGNLAEKPDNEETSAIITLLANLAPLSADMQLLGLADWATELGVANDAFAALVAKRTEVVAGRSKERMVSVRADVEAAYRDIIERLEALCTLNGDEASGAFPAELNAILDRYANILAARRGNTSAQPAPEGKE